MDRDGWIDTVGVSDGTSVGSELGFVDRDGWIEIVGVSDGASVGSELGFVDRMVGVVWMVVDDIVTAVCASARPIRLVADAKVIAV